MGIISENLKHYARSKRFVFKVLFIYLRVTNHKVDEVYDYDLKQNNRVSIEWRDMEGILTTTVVDIQEIEKLARQQKWDIY